jgi:hypothetical protein
MVAGVEVLVERELLQVLLVEAMEVQALLAQ